jgi:hypothetical protein
VLLYLHSVELSIVVKAVETSLTLVKLLTVNLAILYNFEIAVLGARTVLNATAIANTYDPEPYTTAWIYFHGSTTDPPRYQDSNLLPAHIELRVKGIDKFGHFQYKGNTTLIYPVGGEKFMEFWETPHEFIFIDGLHEIKVLDVSSEDSKYQFETNKSTLALTWAVVGLTVVIFRGFVKEIIEDIKWRAFPKPRKWPEDPDWY